MVVIVIDLSKYRDLKLGKPGPFFVKGSGI